MVADPVFLDTSLIVAASVNFHPGYPAAVSYLTDLVKEETPLCISPQVCREFMTALTRKPIGGKTFTVPEALDALGTWHKTSILLEENGTTIQEWLRLVEKHDVRGKQVHDCNIVAVMLANGVRRLGTRNAPDFARFENEVSVEPILS
ncbi:MAG: type II toxin-antitoxin system VapC family toxin [Myxococcales bacterium]|nr:type II toxin-antitoxin system VapC family toxin [Myxococcales bacterium]